LSRNVRRIPIKREAAEEDTRRLQPKEEGVEMTDWQAQVARLRMELERCYRNQERRIETHVAEQQAEFLRAFLSIVDNLERALTHLQRDDALFAGVHATYEEMLALLHHYGVEPIQAEGQPFDPLLHEAVDFVPAPADQEVPLKVAQMIRRGYRWGERVLRPAQVVVARRAA